MTGSCDSRDHKINEVLAIAIEGSHMPAQAVIHQHKGSDFALT